MKKLKLDLDEISVVSFTTEMATDDGGTVNGFSPDTEIGCGGTGGATDGGHSCRICLPMPDSYTCDFCQ